MGMLELLARPESGHVTLKRVATSGAIASVLLIALAIPAVCQAQPPPATPAAPPAESSDGTELAKKLSNPISDLVSVPFQFNWEQNVGPDKQTRFVLNIQPVMPFALTPKMNLITRIIVPFVSQPPLVPDGTAAAGVSDILASFFFSPNSGSSFTWGVGPAISLPSTTEPTLGTEKWSAGPTLVLLKQQGPWTVGALWNQIWSFSGSTARDDVNQMFVQPFLAYTTKNAVTLTLQSESVGNFAADGDQWTVPINVIVSKVSSFGMFPASYQLGFGGFAVHPDGGPSWKMRGAIVLLLPKRP
jgi:hypothetical protein